MLTLPAAPAVIIHPLPSRLQAAARDVLTEFPDALVLVPNVAAGRELRASVGGRFRTRTLSQDARALLADEGLQPAASGTQLDCLRAALAGLQLEYLEGIKERLSTLAALVRVFRELMRAAVLPRDFLEAAGSPRERDLARAYGAYWRALADHGHYDPGAAELVASGLAGRRGPVLVHAFAYLDAAQVAYLLAVAAAGTPVFLTLPYREGSAALSEAERTLAAFREGGWEELRLPECRADGFGERVREAFIGSAPGVSVSLRVCADAEAEARAALARVAALLEDGVPAREVTVLVRDEEAYLPALEAAARELGIGLTSGYQRPLASTPVGALTGLLLEANLAGFPYRATRRLLSGSLGPELVDLGRATWRLGRVAPAGLEAWLPFAHEPECLLALQLPPEGTGAQMAQALRAALLALGLQRSSLPANRVALNAVARSLRDLDGSREALTLADFAARVLQRLALEHVPFLVGRSGVRVHSPLAALGRSFRYVVALGLADGVFPKRPAGEPLLDTFARQALAARGIPLNTAAGRMGVERAFFATTLAVAGESLLLTRPARDAEGRELQPSPFLGGLALAADHAPAPPLAASARLAREALAGKLAPGDEGVAGLAARAGAIEARREGSGPADGFDGRLACGLPQRLEATWSPSQLHDLGACRFKWFLKKGLGLQPLPQPPAEVNVMALGTLYHETLRLATEAAIEAGEPSAAGILARLESAFALAESAFRRDGEDGGSPDWARERREHLLALRRAVLAPDFLPPGNRPVLVERDFPQAGQEAAIEVGGRSLRLRGTIDRVDEGPNGLEVVDYKLNEYVSRVRENGKLSLEVQLALYLRVGVGAIGLGGEAVRGRYFSLGKARNLTEAGPAVQPQPRRPYDWGDHWARVTAFLEAAVADVEEGNFAVLPDAAGEACKRCDYADACRQGPRLRRKLRAGAPAPEAGSLDFGEASP